MTAIADNHRHVFNLNIPTPTGQDDIELKLKAGEIIFFLGANGTGKSSLMAHFAKETNRNGQKTKWISAHRQTWMRSNSVDISAARRSAVEHRIKSAHQNVDSRFRDLHAEDQTNLVLYDLINAFHKWAVKIALSQTEGRTNEIEDVEQDANPISTINELLAQSNLPVQITLSDSSNLLASKSDGDEYNAAQLSDGERNLLLLTSDVLTAESKTLLIIDEPERHLHQSICTPLLGSLFKKKPDCAFVVATHDFFLPLEFQRARTLILRGCTFEGDVPRYWEADELPANDAIDDSIKRDLLGARRKILFVEGIENSLDKAIYELLFPPTVTVRPKGGWNEVAQAVAELRERKLKDLHWLDAYGIIDGDGYDLAKKDRKLSEYVHPLPFYSVEALYYHPEIIGCIAKRKSQDSNGAAESLRDAAISAGVKAIAKDTIQVSEKAIKKLIRKKIMDQIPDDNCLLNGKDLCVVNDALSIKKEYIEWRDRAVNDCNWTAILEHYPLKASNAKEAVAHELGYANADDYLAAVRNLLESDEPDGTAVIFFRDLFSKLFKQLVESESSTSGED